MGAVGRMNNERGEEERSESGGRVVLVAGARWSGFQACKVGTS